ncbi:hypothetical protein KFK09_022891 [Dendrobium nobile]|uniref:Uncharacterized protein n=1 Tax=Dendrobium nobile TaxID=94219 RepID=A0A8T3AKR9_DENNO|nr:hypothetical protein KFK09_022891 [Dendrobium nobile]
MAKSASFAVAILLLLSVSFAARPFVDDEDFFADGPELAPAPLLAWGPVIVDTIPGLDDGPDSLIPSPGPVDLFWPSADAPNEKLGD